MTNDAYHYVGGDLALSAGGDILLASGTTYSQQRILRRLMTALGGYIWNLTYGGGLPQFIGQPANAPAIQAVIRQQMMLEATIAQTPAPVINVTANGNSVVTGSIVYTSTETGETNVLTLPE